MNKKTIQLILGSTIVCIATNYVYAENSHENKFDYYILATEWTPSLCVIGTSKNDAELDDLRACQQQVNRPLMYHGFWPENNDGSYPIFCSLVPKLDYNKLTFVNPYKNYLANPNEFLSHEWSKHGTCSDQYKPAQEHTNPDEYYKHVNYYFQSSINLYQKIKIPTLDLSLGNKNLLELIHNVNPQIPANAIVVTCEKDKQQQYLTGLWFCVDKSLNKFIPCSSAILKTSCTGTMLTR